MTGLGIWWEGSYHKTLRTKPVPGPFSRGVTLRQDSRAADVPPACRSASRRPVGPSGTFEEDPPVERSQLLGRHKARQRGIAETTVSCIILCHHNKQGRC